MSCAALIAICRVLRHVRCVWCVRVVSGVCVRLLDMTPSPSNLRITSAEANAPAGTRDVGKSE